MLNGAVRHKLVGDIFMPVKAQSEHVQDCIKAMYRAENVSLDGLTRAAVVLRAEAQKKCPYATHRDILRSVCNAADELVALNEMPGEAILRIMRIDRCTKRFRTVFGKYWLSNVVPTKSKKSSDDLASPER